MVVCKFFQQGSCRYGQSCRFEHIYGSKYSYNANPAPQSQPSGITDEQLVNQVQSDVQSALKGGQWILSTYAPLKGNLPGLSDLSPEEARLFIYEAKANNNVEQAVAFMNNLFQETRGKYEQLLYPNPAMVQMLRKLLKGERISSPFETANTNASTLFRSALQTPTQPSQPSIFAQNMQNAQSLFAQANKNIAASVFSQAPTEPPSAFGVNANPTSIFASASKQFFGNETKSMFPNSAPTNIFQMENKPVNVFSKNVFEQTVDFDGVYSKMEDLTQADLEAFSSDSFRLGFIPELPPTQELCM